MIEEYLNAEEIMRVAMNMEEQGIEFYTEMAKKADQQETADIFLNLAKDEKEHLKTFRGLLEAISGGTDPWGSPPDQEREINAYLRSLIQLQTFGDKETEGTRDSDLSPEEALRFAIRAEKDAIVYYHETAGYATPGAAAEAFEQIAGEERDHLIILTRRLTAIIGLESEN